MYNCLVSTIADEAFDECTNTSVLSLSRNNITHFPRLSGMNESLKELSLYNNHIAEVPAERIEELVNLKHLQLSTNKLSTFPNVPGPSGSLDELILNRNAFSTFPNLSVIGIMIQRLDMSYNQIVSFSEQDVSVLPKLRWLNLYANLIHEVPVLQSLPLHLGELSLSSNPVSYLPRETIMYMTQHGWKLYLSGSRLTTIPSPCSTLAGFLNIAYFSHEAAIDLCRCDNLWLKLIQTKLLVPYTRCSGLSWKEASLQDLLAVCTQPAAQPYKGRQNFGKARRMC